MSPGLSTPCRAASRDTSGSRGGERAVVGRRDQRPIHQLDVLIRPVIPAGRHRDARGQLVRAGQRDLAVSLALDVGIDVAIGARETEVRRAARTDLVVLRDVVAVGGQDDAGARGPCRVDRTVEPVAGLALHARRVDIRKPARQPLVVLAPARLERGAAVAEKVVRGAEARRDVVVPARQVPPLGKEPRRHEPAGRIRRLFIHRLKVVDAEAGVQRQPLDRPGVLHVVAQVVVHVHVSRPGRGVHRHALSAGCSGSSARGRPGARCRRVPSPNERSMPTFTLCVPVT